MKRPILIWIILGISLYYLSINIMKLPSLPVPRWPISDELFYSRIEAIITVAVAIIASSGLIFYLFNMKIWAILFTTLLTIQYFHSFYLLLKEVHFGKALPEFMIIPFWGLNMLFSLIPVLITLYVIRLNKRGMLK